VFLSLRWCRSKAFYSSARCHVLSACDQISAFCFPFNQYERKGTSMTATTTTNPYPNVSPPPGAVWAEEWQPEGHRHYRNFDAEERSIGDSIRVWAHGVQHDDGRIDDGTADQTPSSVLPAYLSMASTGRTPSAATRRAVSPNVLVMAADEIDRWSAR
jgi:hypothetical protein